MESCTVQSGCITSLKIPTEKTVWECPWHEGLFTDGLHNDVWLVDKSYTQEHLFNQHLMVSISIYRWAVTSSEVKFINDEVKFYMRFPSLRTTLSVEVLHGDSRSYTQPPSAACWSSPGSDSPSFGLVKTMRSWSLLVWPCQNSIR